MPMTSPTLVLQVVRTLAARILYQLLVRQGSLSQQKVLHRMLMELYSSTFPTATALAPPHTFNIQATFCAVQMCDLYERPITQNMNYQSWGRKCYAVLVPTSMELVSQRIKGSRGSATAVRRQPICIKFCSLRQRTLQMNRKPRPGPEDL